jgi:hypothetical protein
MALDKRIPTAKNIKPYVLDNGFFLGFVKCRFFYLTENVYDGIRGEFCT